MGNHGSDGLSTGERIETRGNVHSVTTARERRKTLFELLGLWLTTLLGIRLLVYLHSSVGMHEVVLGVVPLLFIYAPVWLCNWRDVDSYSYRLFIPSFSSKNEWLKAVLLALKMNVATWIWFVPLYVWYRTIGVELIFGWEAKDFVGTLPKDLLLTILFQIFYVALPEEFFYRGYFQTRLNELYPRKWTIWGVQIGMGAVIANLFFAFGHSIVQFKWWHFATFFPGMLFAWAREKNNGILPGALFHASCNIGIILLDTAFGLLTP